MFQSRPRASAGKNEDSPNFFPSLEREMENNVLSFPFKDLDASVPPAAPGASAGEKISLSSPNGWWSERRKVV